MVDIVLEWITADDPRMAEASEVRHVALFEPFGLPRVDTWNDDSFGACHLIASVDGSVAGYACLIVDGAVGQVRQVCVQPRLRGVGVGRVLMTEVVEEARRRSLDSLWLNARVTAQDFYLRLGWVVTSESFPFGRTGVAHVRMVYPTA